MSKALSYDERLAASRAKYAAIRPPTPTPPTVQPPDVYHLLNLKLSPGKTTYFAAFIATNDDTRHSPHPKPSHMAIIRECGEPMQHCPHQIDFYTIPPQARILDDIQNNPPVFSRFSRPFLFHSTAQAHAEITRLVTIETAPET